MQQCTGHWNPFAGRRPALGHGVPGRRPARPALGHGSAGRRPALACTGAGRRPALACTGGTSECRAAGRRPALAGPKARHCGARSVRAAQWAVRCVRRAAQQYAHLIHIIIYTAIIYVYSILRYIYMNI